MKLIFPSNSCSSFRVSFASICCYITTSHSIRTQKSKWPCRDKYSALQQLISMVFSSLHRIMSFLLKKFNSEATTVRAARSPANNQYSIQRGTRGGGGTTQRERKKTQQEEQQSWSDDRTLILYSSPHERASCWKTSRLKQQHEQQEELANNDHSRKKGETKKKKNNNNNLDAMI